MNRHVGAQPRVSRLCSGAALPGTFGERQSFDLVLGRLYELRVSGDVAVAFGGEEPSVLSPRVYRDVPFRFVADVQSLTLSASTTETATAWLFEEVC